MTISGSLKESTFFSFIAFGRNVFLGAQTDEDFGYSVVVTMAVEPEKLETGCRQAESNFAPLRYSHS